MKQSTENFLYLTVAALKGQPPPKKRKKSVNIFLAYTPLVPKLYEFLSLLSTKYVFKNVGKGTFVG